MAGSGTVLRQASDLGHVATGLDVDPLAVLMSKVWTAQIDVPSLRLSYQALVEDARSSSSHDLEWIAQDSETSSFVDYWFAEPQRKDLSRLASSLRRMKKAGGDKSVEIDALSLCLSRIIVTKEQAASLARDTSHSRPHRVSTTSEYDVFAGYDRAFNDLAKKLAHEPPRGGVTVELGDARRMASVPDGSVDAVVTSPPYLNAIDYLRGHRMALVWLGWTMQELRAIRSGSIGAERGPEQRNLPVQAETILDAMRAGAELPQRHRGMIARYAVDLWAMVSEVARVLKSGGHATFVVGNSCLRGTFIKNSDGVAAAAELTGLRLVASSERALPEQSRYLPTTGTTLGKRMRTETVLVFAAA
jgi:hypothetical protein